MPLPSKNFIGVLQSNQYGRRFSGNYPTGNRPAAPYSALLKEDFSSYTVGTGFPGFHNTSIIADSNINATSGAGLPGTDYGDGSASPLLTGKAMRVGISAMTPPLCGGSMNYGGRKVLPQPIPYGSRVWFSMRLFHPKNQTWGYCYDASDAAAAATCGKTADGNEWLKFMVMAPSASTARVYVQPKSLRRQTVQSPGVMCYSEHSQQPSINADALLPLGKWYTLQMEVFLSEAGYVRYWINNTLMAQSNFPPIAVGDSLNEWGIGDYWNGCPFTDGSAATHFFVKDIIIATNAPGFTAPTDVDGAGNIFIAPTRIPREFA